jgi:HEAT repeat protein
MFGLKYGELAVLIGGGYLVLRVLFAVGKVIWWYIIDARRLVGMNPHSPLLSALATAVLAGGLFSIITGWPFAGARIMAYIVIMFVACFMGMVFDFLLDLRLYSLSTWLTARRVPQYRERLLYGEPDVRLGAAQRLSSLGAYARPARPELLATFRDESADVRAAAVDAICSSLADPPDDDPEIPKAARLVLSDPDVRVRVYAAAILTQYGAPAADVLPVLCEGLTNPDPNVAGAATQSLGRLGPAAEPAIPALREAVLFSSEPNYSALETLGKIGLPALPVLIEALDRGDSLCKRVAADVLGELGEPARVALPALRKLTLQSDILVSGSAKKAIEKLGGNIQ